LILTGNVALTNYYGKYRKLSKLKGQGHDLNWWTQSYRSWLHDIMSAIGALCVLVC